MGNSGNKEVRAEWGLSNEGPLQAWQAKRDFWFTESPRGHPAEVAGESSVIFPTLKFSQRFFFRPLASRM
jgi:hypothetical protein